MHRETGLNEGAIPTISTRLTKRFGVRHPFACAGLAFAGMTPPLAVAVTKAGGIGAFGAGKLPVPAIEASMDAIRAQTDGAVNLNFITIFTDEEHIALCERIRPAIVSFHWGHPPRAWIDRLRAVGISVWEQVGSVAAARLAVDDGIEVIIAQGTEAGGHNLGTLPLFALLPAIIDEVAQSALVLAAGAISDGRGVAAALAMGADGVWVGTRMIATQEADICAAYKQALLSGQGSQTVLSSIFGKDIPDFNPMRVIANTIVEEYAGREDDAPDDPATQPIIGQMQIGGMDIPLHRFTNIVPMSNATGDIEQLPLLAGQGLDLINDLPPAGEVVERMMAQARQRLDAFAQGDV